MDYFYAIQPNVEMISKRKEVPNQITVAQIEKFFRDKEYRQVEDIIIQSLFFHHYLTKINITRFSNRRLKADNKKDFYGNILKQLYKDGCIEILTYGNITLYTLSDQAREYATMKYKNIRNREFTPPEANTDTILECASLAQWHISLVCGENIRRSYFYEKAHIGNLPIQFASYLEFMKGEYCYHVISNILPKKNETTEKFFQHIKALSHAFRSNIKVGKKHVFLNVLIVPDLDSIKKVAAVLQATDATKDMTFYFILEEQTHLINGLKILYTYENTGRDILIATIKFKE